MVLGTGADFVTPPPARPRPEQFTREELAVDPVDAVPLVLGSVLRSETPQGPVSVRVVEVEAYRGADDPASHCYRGRTRRNQVMFGPAGHLYVYFVYGMHFCANIVCLTDGIPGALLVRGGEVVEGVELARSRRPASRRDTDLASGPARLTTALGLTASHDGTDLTDPGSPVRLLRGDTVAPDQVRRGPRVGVATAMEVPWRFWEAGSPAVSPYRRGGRRRVIAAPPPTRD
ncbi:DNA-3-methyladenine glycosylase [Actinoalloteichus caeruleus]|uniref:Putative 3-methyladenine DNA glycosylase n=1 Tax=Actinoalloteichus caeruleus DSM 43889 TaxID=1120930 RepID=A0ABT1JGH7_ACTCY|nr:DNA-3-methyladenine glycosylase [Actinoalloteichus caeruleus]MCP2331583.1 DNA-3-methyladenine glycosylase [Actinoalloteichus caeruleus DSM 43889]